MRTKKKKFVPACVCFVGSCSADSAATCDLCLQLGPHCAWCTQEVSSSILNLRTHSKSVIFFSPWHDVHFLLLRISPTGCQWVKDVTHRSTCWKKDVLRAFWSFPFLKEKSSRMNHLGRRVATWTSHRSPHRKWHSNYDLVCHFHIQRHHFFGSPWSTLA